MTTNHYETLGVERDADPGAIKAAHRRKVRKVHPDLGGTHEQCVAVQLAYDVLSDEQRRQRYDETGDDGSGPTLRQQAVTRLAELLVAVLQRVDEKHDDVVQAMRQQIEAQREADRTTRKTLLKQIIERKKTAERFKTSEPENVLAQVVKTQVLHAQQNVERLKMAEELSNEMLAVLDDYRYEVDN